MNDELLGKPGKGTVNVFPEADETRSRLAAIVESSHDAIIGKTLEGVVTSWNGAAERLFGYAADEMVGRPVTAIVPKDRLAEEGRLLALIHTGERIEQYETMRLHRSGNQIEVTVTLSPIRDGSGAIIGVSSVAHDIGERKAAERAILDREERYRSLVEASDAIVYTSDATGSWQERSPAWEAYTGQSLAESRGYGWVDAIHPEDRARNRTREAGFDRHLVKPVALEALRSSLGI